jgi:hypothetical protein
VSHLDVAYVAMAIHVCCKCMFHLFQMHVASIFIWMLHMFHYFSGYTHVASVYSKCLTSFRRMLQVVYLDVAYVAVVIHICCKSRL